MKVFSIRFKSSYAPHWLTVLIATQLVIAVVLGFPGHLSADSIIQLYEGRTLHFVSFHPPLLSQLLGLLERLGSGPVGFVLISATLLAAGSWLALRGSWASTSQRWRRVLAAVLVLNPILLLYTGIVWKDVLFAHAILLAFMLPDALRLVRGPWRAAGMALLLILLAIIIGARQQGILFALVLAGCAAWRFGSSLWPRLGLLLLLVAVPFLANKAATDFAFQRGLNEMPPGGEVGVRILMRYDLVGMMAHGAQGTAVSDDVMAELQGEIPKYSSYRVDTLDGPSAVYWRQPFGDIFGMWLGEIRSSPLSYLQHRFEVFSRLLGMGEVQACLPYHRGVVGPVQLDLVSTELTALLGLTPSAGSWSQEIYDLVSSATQTPLFWHWCYLLAAAGLLLVFVRRRDWLPASLVGCTIIFVGSYALIGIACDFRYGYALTVVVSIMGARALLGRGNANTEQPDAIV